MKKIILFILPIFLLTSCEDFFEATVEADPPNFESKMVANMEIIVGADLMVCELSHNISSFELQDGSHTNIFIPNAKLELFSENQFIAQFTQDNSQANSLNYSAPQNIDFITGNVYDLKGSHPDYKDIKGTAKVQSLVTTGQISFSKTVKSDMYGGDLTIYKFDMDIIDDEDVDNYYEVLLYRKDIQGNQTERFYNLYISSDIEMDSYNQSLLYSDNYINTVDNKISFEYEEYGGIDDGNTKVEDLYILVKSISKDFYTYKKSFYANRKQDGNPFSSPIQIYSNIENGLGIFAISNAKLIPVVE